MMKTSLLPVFVLLSACRTLAPEEPRPPEKPVDRACLDRARAGTMLTALPARVGDFDLAVKNERTFTLHRMGRPLTVPEGQALWSNLGSRTLPTGLTMGSSALHSVYKCEGVADASCLTFSLRLCTTSIERFTGELASAAAAVNAPDGELFVNVTAEEGGGPSCKDGPRCIPASHYSTKDTAYRTTRPRTAISGWSAGQCEDDGDCEGGGNTCHAWYLRGGAELTIYIQHSEPAFCGCVARQCTWFTQE